MQSLRTFAMHLKLLQVVLWFWANEVYFRNIFILFIIFPVLLRFEMGFPYDATY